MGRTVMEGTGNTKIQGGNMKKGVKPITKFIFTTMIVTLFALPVMAGGSGNQDLEDTVRMLMEQNKRLMEQNRQLAERLKHVEKDMARMKGSQAAAVTPAEPQEEETPWYHRLSIEGGATGVLQASANNADNDVACGDKADMAYTVDLNIESDLEQYGTFHIHIEGGDGEGMNDDVPSFSVPNYDAYATWNNNNQADLTFSEAFYENLFWDEKIDFNLGKMDLSVLFDENEAAGDETTQFLSNIFVKSMGVNIPEPGGFYCPTLMVAASPVDFVEFRFIGASVDNNEEENTWENVFSNPFIAAQVNFKPMLLNRPGNYRFYAWNDSRRYMDVDDVPTATNEYREGSDALSGWGLSFDQEIADGFTAFARYSWREGDLTEWNSDDDQWEIIPTNQAYSLGLSIDGTLWNRGNDGIGLAFGQTILSDDFKGEHDKTSNEEYVEAYYRYAVFERLAITADFQWIGDPGGLKTNDDVFLFGLRSQIDF